MIRLILKIKNTKHKNCRIETNLKVEMKRGSVMNHADS